MKWVKANFTDKRGNTFPGYVNLKPHKGHVTGFRIDEYKLEKDMRVRTIQNDRVVNGKRKIMGYISETVTEFFTVEVTDQ